MPEAPNPKLRDVPPPAKPAGASRFPYVELDVKTNYSFLRGASHPDELVYRAAEWGYRGIAVADLNSLAGVVRAHEAAREAGIPLIIGTRLTFADAPDLLVWAPDRAAYARLCRLLTLGKRRAEKGQCALNLADFLNENTGLLAAVCDDGTGEEANGRGDGVARRRGEKIGRAETEDDCREFSAQGNLQIQDNDIFPTSAALGVPVSSSHPLALLKDALQSRLSLAANCAYSSDDVSHLNRLSRLSRQFGIPLVATNAVHYHDPGRRMLQDVLTCIRHGCTIREAGYRLFPNGERYLKSPEQMHRLFADHPQAITRGLEIAGQCTFSLDELRYEYPDELTPPGKTATEYLAQLAWEGAAGRYPTGIPEKVSKLLHHELALIQQLRFEHYFLTVYDLVKFARSRGILCQGRGSAANSAVCYCIGVTSVDPDRIDVLFERFMSAARGEPPDIDVDFEHERREEVLQYLFDKYGRDRAAMTAEVITYRGRSAIRDVGKAMGLSLDMVDSLSGKLDWWNKGVVSDEQIRASGLDPADRTMRQVMTLSTELLGFPRHLSQHVGGMVMTRGPLCEMVPIENASMPDRTVIEWDKNDIDAVGILKVDVLALGMLTCISKGLAMINEMASVGSAVPNVAGGECSAQRNLRDASRDTGVPPVPAVPDVEETYCAESERTRHGRDARDTAESSLRPSPFTLHPSFSSVSPHPSSSSLVPALELHTVPPEDPAVYDMICNADTVGVFQIESRAQMSMLPRLRPRCFYDLVIEVAIVRPGPIQGDMVHPYLRRRNGDEPVSFPSEALRQVLEKTLGVPLFQEQAMRVAMVGAGFTADEADKLRRVMAAWRRTGAIDTFHKKIVTGMVGNGYTPEFAEQCFNQIRGFGEYGFPESHAASFALLVYVSAWLKRHHPAVFATALLNSQPMGFYMPAQIVRDAKEHGVTVRAVDVNASGWDCSLEVEQMGQRDGGKGQRDEGTEGQREGERERETGSGRDGETNGNTATPAALTHSPSLPFSISPTLRLPLSPSPPLPLAPSQWGRHGPALRLGYRQLKGFRQAHAEPIVAARRKVGAFTTIAQFHRLTGLPVSASRILAEADAFASMGLTRREALWQVMKLKDEHYPLFDDLETPESKIQLPTMPEGQEVMIDYATAGLSLKKHPVALLREELRKRKIITAAELLNVDHNRWVKVAGLVLIRQRPGTAAGIVFETLEDETGIVNIILHEAIYDRYRAAARHARLLQADGYVQRHGQIIHVLPKRLFDLSDLLSGYKMGSRDFH